MGQRFIQLFAHKTVRIAGILVVIGLLASVPSIYFYNKYKASELLLKQPNAASQMEIQSLIAAVSKLIDLPATEQPTVATVTDKEKLKQQAFFAKAENGDKVLVYTKSRKAILYRPSANKIIDVAPISIPADSTATASATVSGAQSEGTYSVTLRNGSTRQGLTGIYETELASKAANLQVVGLQAASRATYEQSLLIDVKGDKQAETRKLAQSLGLSLSSLPEGEATPASDFLIILGADKQ